MSDQMLGELCLMGELLDSVKGVSDDIFEMLDTEKVGQELRRSDQGEYTGQGYIYSLLLKHDGIHLPEQFMVHDGMISLRLEPVCPVQEPIADIWLELPAEKAEMQQVLDSIRRGGAICQNQGHDKEGRFMHSCIRGRTFPHVHKGYSVGF